MSDANNTTVSPEQRPWISCRDQLPTDGEVVEARIDDGEGVRNEWPLKRRGSLWFYPDESMYVYYTPTHWRPKV